MTLLLPVTFIASQVTATEAVMRDIPDPLYGVTVDRVSDVQRIIDSSVHLPHMPTTRIVFDPGMTPADYAPAINRIQPVSYILGELVDSSSMRSTSFADYRSKTDSFLAALGDKVDIWEVGNEVNGNWTGNYSSVSAKISTAHSQVKAAGKRSMLNLWYNAGCEGSSSELGPLAFSSQYVPQTMRDTLDYVSISYYETQCNNVRPTPAQWQLFFEQLHTLYPNSKLGFGEIGFPRPVGKNQTRISKATSMINYYYGLHLDAVLPYYVRGNFWWYYYQDMLPYNTKPLWPVLNAALG